MRQPLHHAFVALVAMATACGYDGAGSYQPSTAPPPPPPPPPATSLVDGLWTASGSDPALLRLGAPQLTASGTIAAGTTVTTASASLVALHSIAVHEAGPQWDAGPHDAP